MTDYTDKYDLVQKCVFMYGTMSPTEIQKLIKSTLNMTISRPTIYKHLQTLKESNLSWISDQAKAGYLETVRQLAYEKKARLVNLREEFNDSTGRVKVEFGRAINETEESLINLMEGLPLLMQFRSIMNNEQEDTIEIRT